MNETDQEQSSLSKMKDAISYMLQALKNIRENMSLWINSESNMSELYSKYYGLFNHDE